MEFHVQEKLSRIVGFILTYLLIIGMCLFIGAMKPEFKRYAVFAALFFTFCGVIGLIKKTKKTVVSVRDKTITVNQTSLLGKNETASLTFAYGDIKQIENMSGLCTDDHFIYLKRGKAVAFPCGCNKELDNFINGVIAELRTGDPRFNLNQTGQQEDKKEFKIFFKWLVFVNILLAAFCLTVTTDVLDFFNRWWPYAAAISMIMMFKYSLAYQNRRRQRMKQKQDLNRYLHLDIKKKKKK